MAIELAKVSINPHIPTKATNYTLSHSVIFHKKKELHVHLFQNNVFSEPFMTLAAP